jgi:hypothetical protein
MSLGFAHKINKFATLFVQPLNLHKNPQGCVMRLPEVASRLRELAIKLGCDELDELADENRTPVTQTTSTNYLCPDDRCTKSEN